MIYPAAFCLLIVSGSLLFLGGVQGRFQALYLLKGLWLILGVVALYFGLDAWQGRHHSENWAMIGMLFVVWPITGFVCLATVVELFLIRKKTGSHMRANRILAMLASGGLLLLSFAPVFF